MRNRPIRTRPADGEGTFGLVRPRGRVPNELEHHVTDLVAIVVTIAVFALIALIANGAAKL